MPDTYDVIVVGGGNAGLVAAISARHIVNSVLLLERAPTWRRGGNSRDTRDIRYAHARGEPFTTGQAYPVEELMDDLLVNTYYETAHDMGVEVEYESSVEDVLVDADHLVRGVLVESGGARREIRARSVVLTSGGFEANLDWLRRYWGDSVDNYVIRGTPYNDGRVLAALLDRGAATAGDAKGFHAVALDARAPKFDGGIATRLDSVPFGIALNKNGKRFYDEGQDFWPKRYAIWGRLIAEQPDQIAVFGRIAGTEAARYARAA